MHFASLVHCSRRNDADYHQFSLIMPKVISFGCRKIGTLMLCNQRHKTRDKNYDHRSADNSDTMSACRIGKLLGRPFHVVARNAVIESGA